MIPESLSEFPLSVSFAVIDTGSSSVAVVFAGTVTSHISPLSVFFPRSHAPRGNAYLGALLRFVRATFGHTVTPLASRGYRNAFLRGAWVRANRSRRIFRAVCLTYEGFVSDRNVRPPLFCGNDGVWGRDGYSRAGCVPLFPNTALECLCCSSDLNGFW